MPDQFGGIEVEEETEVSVGMRDEFGGIPVEPSGVTGGPVEEQMMAAESEVPMLDAYGQPIMPPAAEPQIDREFQEKLIGVAEVLMTLASGATSGAGGQMVGTLKGLAQEILSGEFGTAEAAQRIQESAMRQGAEGYNIGGRNIGGTYAPRTQLGQEYTQETAEALGSLPALAPLVAETGAIRAGLAGAAQAARAGAVPAVQQMGVQAAKQSGRGAYDVMVPEPVQRAVVQPGMEMVTRGVVQPITRGVEAVAGQVEKIQRERTQDVRKILESEPDNADVVKYRIVNDRVISDDLASEALKQGWDPAVLGSIKASSNLDKQKFQKSLNLWKIGKKRKKQAVLDRPAKVVGDSMLTRVNFLMNVKKESGKQIEKISQIELRGKPVNYEQPMNQFISDLADIGISVERGKDSRYKVNLKDSDIEGDVAGEELLNRALKRLSSTKVPDAYDVHRAKRWIDTQVSWGKRRANPLTAEAEYALKTLRRNLNKELGIAFPKYRDANTRFSESLTALNELQTAVGKQVDFEGDMASEAFGLAMRKVLSNYGSRNTILQSIDAVETTAKKYGLKIEDDLINQIIFVNEVDRMFGAVAPGSLKGQIEQGLQKGSDFARSSALEKAVTLVGKSAEAVRGINEENAIKSIEAILRRQKLEPIGTEVTE